MSTERRSPSGGVGRRRARRIVWLGGYRSDMIGTKAEALAALADGKGLRLPAARLFRPWRIRRRIPRRHDLELARRKPCGVPPLRAGPHDPGRLVDGRLDRAAHGRRNCARPAQGGRIAGLVLLAPAPDFTTELIEPTAHQEAEEARSGREWLFRGAVGLFRRAQRLYPRAVRGRRGEPRHDRADRHALPGPHPAGPGRPGRAAQPCAEAGQPSAGRRPDACR